MKYRYYSTQRPIMPGSFPNKESVEEIHNYDDRTLCEEIGREAWGYIEYKEALTEEQVKAYELTPAGKKKYWCVTSSVDDRGKVVANITDTVETTSKPENSSMSTLRKDIYCDWFESLEEAQAFTKEAKRA